MNNNNNNNNHHDKNYQQDTVIKDDLSDTIEVELKNLFSDADSFEEETRKFLLSLSNGLNGIHSFEGSKEALMIVYNTLVFVHNNAIQGLPFNQDVASIFLNKLDYLFALAHLTEKLLDISEDMAPAEVLNLISAALEASQYDEEDSEDSEDSGDNGNGCGDNEYFNDISIN